MHLDLNVYLAGKVAKNCWRHYIVPDLRGLNQEFYNGKVDWPVLEAGVIVSKEPETLTMNYCGPYFVSCDHGCYHSGLIPHAWSLTDGCGSDNDVDNDRADVVRRCHGAIRAADFVYAWIDTPDCYGTINELGYAKALNKPIVIAGPQKFDDMWFTYEQADLTAFGPNPDGEDSFRRAVKWFIKSKSER